MPFEIPTSVTAPLLIHGDCIEEMRKLPDASVDAYVSDPPSGIAFMHSAAKGRTWDSFKNYEPVSERGREALNAFDVLGMKREDSGFVVFMLEHWLEVRRVLKPGAIVVAWALPKTSDLAGLAMRLAGFEMDLPLLNLFSSGMPKGINVSKAIDKMLGVTCEVLGVRNGNTQGWEPTGPSLSTQVSSGLESGARESGHGIFSEVTAPATPEAERWDGYNSQLAPAFEHWLVGRNPTALTYAGNALEHGCGAYNVRACEIPRGADARAALMRKSGGKAGLGIGDVYGDGERVPYTAGNGYPKNVLLTTGGEGCPAAELDRQSGTLQGRGNTKPETKPGFGSEYTFGDGPGLVKTYGPSDSGGASRFYTQIPIDELDHRFRYGPKARNRNAGLRSDLRNEHNTVKTVSLMRWIMRLVVPTAKATGGLPGVVLSSFMGSGPDGVAAVAEGFRFVGIERDEASFTVAKSRILAAIGSPEGAAEANGHAPVGAQLGLL